MTALHLSPRQVEVCCLVAAGESDKTVAKELGISRHTVRNHVEEAARRIRASCDWIDTPSAHKAIRRYYVEYAAVAAFQSRRAQRRAA